MVTICSTLFILSLNLLCMASGSKSCNSETCSIASSSLPIRYPFRIKDRQPKSCGSPGFDVYCNDNVDQPFLDLPSAGPLMVSNILYSTKVIILRDPNNCLPQKLMSLDLANTPFHWQEDPATFGLYNCSANGFYRDGDQIDCLSNSDYTVVSAIARSTFRNPNCTLMRVVFAPYEDETPLSNLSSITLTWGSSYATRKSKSKTSEAILALLVISTIVIPAIVIGYCCFRSQLQQGQSHSDRGTIMSIARTTTIEDGLDEINSGSYPYPATRRTTGYSLDERTLDPYPYPATDLDERTFDPYPYPATRTTTGDDLDERTFNPYPYPATRTTTGDGLDRITIDSYPTVVIGESGRLIKPDDDSCPICLSNYPGETIMILPKCLHRFHVDCIDEWLLSKATCPNCRTSLPHS